MEGKTAEDCRQVLSYQALPAMLYMVYISRLKHPLVSIVACAHDIRLYANNVLHYMSSSLVPQIRWPLFLVRSGLLGPSAHVPPV